MDVPAGRAPRQARLVHRMPGRLRIKVADSTDDVGFFEAVRRWAMGVPGVTSVRLNAPASCFVVSYSEEPLEVADFAHRLQRSAREHGLLDLHLGQRAVRRAELALIGRHSHLAKAIVSEVREVDQELRVATDGMLDLKVLVPMVLGMMSAVTSRTTGGTPMWLTLAISAFHTFMSLHEHEVAVAAPAPSQVPPTSISLH